MGKRLFDPTLPFAPARYWLASPAATYHNLALFVVNLATLKKNVFYTESKERLKEELRTRLAGKRGKKYANRIGIANFRLRD